MSDNTYHDGHRLLQDRFDTRRLADRIDERLVDDVIDPDDKAFIESLDMFFLATADERGRPNCSYKGGESGFVRVLDEHTVAFPNCPRYIHKYRLVERSRFVPRVGCPTPVPDWKRSGWARDVLPADDPARSDT
jgi:hypothetical protein